MEILKKILSYFFFTDHHARGSADADRFFSFKLEDRDVQEIFVGDQAYRIDVECGSKWPELHTLVLNTESMDSAERQYWLDVIPFMSDDQIDTLFDILEEERRLHKELDERYASAVDMINVKMLEHFIEEERRNALEGVKKKDKIVSNTARKLKKVC